MIHLNKKTAFILVLSLCIFLSFAVVIHSAADFDSGKVFANILPNSVNKAETDAVSDTYIYALESLNEGYLANQGVKGSVEKYDNKMYKVYYAADDFTSLYVSGKDFIECIDSSYFWEVPIIDDGGNIVAVADIKKMPYYDDLVADGSIDPESFSDEMIASIKEVEGTWQAYRTGPFIPSEYAVILSSPQLLADYMRKSGFENPQNVYLISLPMEIYLLYAEEDGQGYGIPFTTLIHNPFENGKVYAISDIVSVFISLKNMQSENVTGEAVLGGVSTEHSIIPTAVIQKNDSNGKNDISILPFAFLVVGILAISGTKLYINKHKE